MLILPFPISLLKSLIPMTRLLSSTSWVTFSEGFRETKGPSASLGMTDSRAARTSFSILYWLVMLESTVVLLKFSGVSSL